MAFRKHSTDDFKPTGTFLKWDKIGLTVEGTWQGCQASKFKDADGHPRLEALVLVDGENKVMPLTTALMSFFDGAFGGVHKVPSGAEFRITYSGNRAVPGQPSAMKVFEVEFDDAAFPDDQVSY